MTDTLSAVATTAVHRQESLLFATLLELTIIVLAGRVGGILARRVGQAAAVGEIIMGILLGPSLFGLLAPQTFAFVFRSASPEPLQILSSLGLVLLMFQIGLEFDFEHLAERLNRKAVLSVSLSCLVAPFVLGLALGYAAAPVLSPQADRFNSALFVATAFSITALPILGRIMLEFDLTRTPLGVIAISAAAINDVIGWLLLALVTALAASQWDGTLFAARVGAVALFVCASTWLVRPLLKRAVRAMPPRHGRLPPNLLGLMLAVIFTAAMATYGIGIFAIFGAFMMGVLLFDETEFVHAWRERIGDFVNVFFLPIFFTYTGLLTSIGSLDSLASWGWCAATVLLATVGKLGAAYLAARFSGFNHAESSILGFMMNTRALMELVVINVGYQLGVISQPMFTILVIMAIFSTVLTTPALRHFLPRSRPATVSAAAAGEAV
ncbi:MAG: cation:proton antiporter [Burkholderiales bacterium]